MPYTLDKPPDRIKGLPKAAQKIWIGAYNAAHEQYKDEGKANATAWAAVKEKYKQEGGVWKLREASKSVNQLENQIWDAIRVKFGQEVYTKDIFPDEKYAIFHLGKVSYKISYSLDKNESVVLGDDLAPVKLEQKYIELSEACSDQIQLIEAVDKEKQGWEWEVVIIEAGESGNGFYYPPEALRAALPLFEGARALARADDEHLKDVNKSVRAIVGWFSNPRYEGNKIKARFHVSEAADWLRVLMLDAGTKGKKDIVGFSIVGAGEIKNKRHGGKFVRFVETIKGIDLVDVVVNPAAGGRILKLAAAVGDTKEEGDMKILDELYQLIESKRPELLEGVDKEKTTQEELLAKLTEALTPPEGKEGEKDAKVNVELLAEIKKLTEAQKPAAKPDPGNAGDDDKNISRLEKIEAALSQSLVTSKLAEAKLPEITAKRIQKRFESRIAEAQEIDDVIAEEREYLGSITPSGQVVGLGQTKLRAGLDSQEKHILALDGFFANQDLKEVPRYRSFREAYEHFTGDHGIERFAECMEVSRTQRFVPLREALTTASWAQILGDSITRRMLAEYKVPGLDDWRKIVSDITSVKDFRTNRRMRMGGYGLLADVAEGGPYQPITSPTDEEATFAISKKGNTEEITMEMVANDDVGSIRRIPRKLARAAATTLYRKVFNLIQDNGNVTYEAVNLFDAAHSNTDTDALAATALLTAKRKMAEQAAYGDSTNILGLVAKWLLIPLELEDTAYRLTVSPTVIGETGAAGQEPNIHSSYGLTPLVIPYWTDATDWVLVCNPADCPTIEVGFFNGKEEPELFAQDMPTVGSMFTADKITYKIRHIYGVCVLDHRGMYKGIVA